MWDFYGSLSGHGGALLVALFALVLMGYWHVPIWGWALFTVGLTYGFGLPLWLMGPVIAVLVVLSVPILRRMIFSSFILKAFKDYNLVPKISATERTALDAGVVWVEGELFSGKPNFKKIMAEAYPKLSAEEQAFLDGPCETVCKMVDDWEVWKTRDLPSDVFEYLKKNKFFGMIIPKKYGGLEFSALANSAVIVKLSSRCLPMATTVMVPNSLGPAELLLHYGTEEQRNKYLPKLAVGEHIPCFALTEPNAGSDAGAIEAEGVLFRDGSEIKIRLNWNKRWITLAAISTLHGIAFKLRDPENILGRGEHLGITCALVPSSAPGVELGRRHDPLGVPFYNCPTRGKDVIISVNDIVGGTAGIGEGWKMLMECLAAGRGISLPGQSTACAKLATRVAGAHSAIRKQFGFTIGKFEGIEEPLARIGGLTYLIDAMRMFTCGALDQGIKPPVVTAIAKYYSTELSRKIINDGMDVLGGAGISLGPRNLLAHNYIGAPIAITVEGANILTRTLMIFGQGALRAHPYAYKEVAAVERNDLAAFDQAFWSHVGHIVHNGFRSVVLSCTRGFFSSTPQCHPEMKRYYQKLNWTSASFALMSDLAMGAFGGSLKQKEKITGRYADILSWMYMAVSVLKRFEAEGSPKEDLSAVHFAMSYSLGEIQKSFDGIFGNFNVPLIGGFMKKVVKFWSQMNTISSGASDVLGHKVASDLIRGNSRKRWSDGIYVPKAHDQALGRLEYTVETLAAAEPIDKKIKTAIRQKQLPKKKSANLFEEALAKGIITKEEAELLALSERLRYDAIQVDEFTLEEYQNPKNCGPDEGKGNPTAHRVSSISEAG